MSLRHALLGLLVDRPASGYDLMKRFDLALARVWPAAQSQLYTELNALAADKLIQVTATGPRGRKVYALTDSGLTELRRWLVDSQPRRERRNDELLRVFFLGVLDHEQAVGYLRKLEADASTNSAELTALDASITWDDDSPVDLRTTRHGIRSPTARDATRLGTLGDRATRNGPSPPSTSTESRRSRCLIHQRTTFHLPDGPPAAHRGRRLRR